MEKVKEFQKMKEDFENKMKNGLLPEQILKKDRVEYRKVFRRLYKAGYTIAEISRILPIERRNLIKWRKEISNIRSNHRNKEFIIKCWKSGLFTKDEIVAGVKMSRVRINRIIKENFV